MILNVWTVSALFLAALGVVLALAAGAAGVRSLAAREPERAADRAHLLALIVGVLLLVRGLAWPHFYLLLESYVPAMAPGGVMCAYGVTRVEPELVLALQWAKPALLVLLAGWWTLALVDRRAEAPAFDRLRQLAIVPIAAAAALECGLEIAWLLRDKLDREVTCCTQVFDLEREARAGGIDPFALAGFASPARTFSAWLAAQGLAAALAWTGARATPRRGLGVVRPIALVFALASLPLALAAWLDFVAPRVLGLPHHHCVYEVLTRAPMMGLAAMLVIGAGVAPAGAALLALARRRAPAAVDHVRRRLELGSALAGASALWIVLVHVA